MEAALRGISLCLTMELLWPFTEDEKPWLDQMTASLWQHLRFIEAHSEFSFLLRSNHYLSNIVGLTTLTAYLQGPGIQKRFKKYARAVNREILVQTYSDGGDCEASSRLSRSGRADVSAFASGAAATGWCDRAGI